VDVPCVVMRLLCRWWLLLVPGGFAAGHEIGYQAARLVGAPPVTGGGQHGYLVGLVVVGILFGFAAVARNLVAGLRDELPRVRLGPLATGQSALFLAVELAEHLHAGLRVDQALAQPAVVFGFVAQLAVAGLLYLIARTSHEIAAAVTRSRRRRGPAAPASRPRWAVVASAVVVVAVPASSLSRRGPPAVLLTA
jgi:hypothetical protein